MQSHTEAYVCRNEPNKCNFYTSPALRQPRAGAAYAFRAASSTRRQATLVRAATC